MSSYDIDHMADWDDKILIAWLNNIDSSSDENSNIEFKEKIHDKGKECRKDFSGFANADGGYILFGIHDRTKQTVGIDNSIDFETRIADHLNPSCIDPEIQWKTIKKFQISKQSPQKYVYAVKIDKTFPFWKRPHISDGIIYLRRHGKTEPIKSLTELRQGYFQKNIFFPEDVIYLDTLVQELALSQFEIDLIDPAIVRLWIGISHYLSEEIQKGFPSKKASQGNDLRNLYRKIGTGIENIKRQKSKTLIDTGVSVVMGQDTELKSFIENTSNDLVEFKIRLVKYLKV